MQLPFERVFDYFLKLDKRYRGVQDEKAALRGDTVRPLAPFESADRNRDGIVSVQELHDATCVAENGRRRSGCMQAEPTGLWEWRGVVVDVHVCGRVELEKWRGASSSSSSQSTIIVLVVAFSSLSRHRQFVCDVSNRPL
jgi:hypothetical protein